MQKNKDIRTIKLIGQSNFEKLTNSKVLLIGVGGVGGYVCEALARCGIGKLDIIDGDVVSESNINRQIIATYDTIGKAKVEVAYKRIMSISPDCNVSTYYKMYIPDSEFSQRIDFGIYDFVIDAIDDIPAKIDIINRCKLSGTPIISSMGTGNRIDNTHFKIKDISETSDCPLAKKIRKELKRLEISDVSVLFADSPPVKNIIVDEKLYNEGSDTNPSKNIIGSISYVPATAGLMIAGYVVNQLIDLNKT